jgi:transcriptional regulator with XRE-family HTH domain
MPRSLQQDNPVSRFGQNLRALRKRAGLSQSDVAQRMKLESQALISLWETGRNLPEPDSIQRLANAIGCHTSELLIGVVTPYDKLRGTIDVLIPDAEEILLTAAEKRRVRVWRRIPADYLALADRMIDALVRHVTR